MNRLRFWTVTLLLTGAVVILYARPSRDRIAAREPLAQLPATIDGWGSTDLEIDQETRDVLGDGDFLSRNYIREGQPAPIDLFIAYFPSQRTGSTIHSPKHCLPGAGWTFDSSRYVDLVDDAGRTHRVGEYIISNGEIRQFVIYWYEAHGRSVASEYWAKVYLVEDAMRMNRTDGALVRVITPIVSDGGEAQAKARAEGFARKLAPALTRFIPG
ncbi:MAG: exosortase C-terminal domain/associated protein EpsI [Terracidiphilus sp.]